MTLQLAIATQQSLVRTEDAPAREPDLLRTPNDSAPMTGISTLMGNPLRDGNSWLIQPVDLVLMLILTRAQFRAHVSKLIAMGIARGTFEIVMTPGTPEINGAIGRFDFTKSFHGDLDATGIGVMLSAGDPLAGEAGYVAIETVRGSLAGQAGDFALQQFGTAHEGSQNLHYEIVPGSGHEELTGITGTLLLTIEDDGTHRYELDYEV